MEMFMKVCFFLFSLNCSVSGSGGVYIFKVYAREIEIESSNGWIV